VLRRSNDASAEIDWADNSTVTHEQSKKAMESDILWTKDESSASALTRWGADVSALFKLVKLDTENIFLEAGFYPVSSSASEKIRAGTGIEVSGYEHILDTSSIRHILKKHGTESEYRRGQVPITEQDFIELSHLFEGPDTISYAGKTRQGLDAISYTKEWGGHTVFFVEEVRTKKSRLAAVTLYKRKIKLDPTPDASS
jgi:hypothetical protein